MTVTDIEPISFETDLSEPSSANAVRRSEERYRLLINSISEVLWTTDADGQVEDMPQWRAITGQTREQVKGYGWLDALHPDDRALTAEIWQRAVETRGIYDTEYRIVQLDGSYRTYNSRGVPIIENDGKIREWVGVCIDIEKQKQAEIELQNIRRDLEMRVEARTDALSEAVNHLSAEINERKRVETEQQVVSNIIQSVATTANIDELLELVHHELSRVVNAENCYVALFDKSTGLFSLPLFLDQSGDSAPAQPSIGRGATAYVFRTNQPARLTKNDFRRLIDRGEFEQIGTLPAVWMGVPLTTSSETIGVLAVQHYSDASVYEERDVQFLSTVGDQIAIAIERKYSEEIKQRFVAMVEATPDLVAMVNTAKDLVFLNKAGRKMLGIGATEDISQISFESKQPEWVHRLMSEEIIPKVLRQKIWTGETAFYDADKREIATSQVILAHKNSDGKIDLFSTIARDITESKRIERELAEAAQKESAMIENALDVICSIDAHGCFASVSPACLNLWGYRQEELIGHPYMDLIADEDLEITREAAASIMSGKVTNTFENRYRHKNGSLINVMWTAFWSDAEQLMFCVAHDMTERKRIAEQQSAILDALPAHICLLDKDGNILEVNNEWKKFAVENGYRGSDFGIGSNYLETCEETQGECGDSAKQVAAMCRAVLAGEITEYEMEYPCHSPTENRWFKLMVTPLNKEKTAGAVIMHVNITERKRIEAELEQTRDAALESTRLKSEFLANMSHEIRTPMNGVMGMTGLLLDTNLSREQREFALDIQTSADSLLTIINDILDFSKIEAGMLNFENIKFDLRDPVEGSIELLAARAFAKNLEISSFIHADVPLLLKGDPGRLRQIITNLVSNAIKFTKTGEVSVQARKMNETKTHLKIRFEVRDTGIGINAEAQKNLFRAFIQADSSTTRKYGGTGLGLAISKQLTELMDGEIGVESEVGKGSTFWFTVRFEKQKVKENVNLAAIADWQIAGLRVLIVEENHGRGANLTRQTEAWRMSAANVASGAEALPEIRRAARAGKPYDLLILDLPLPQPDGFDLARLIKSDPEIAPLKIVLLAAFGYRGQAETARQSGIDAYLIKPVRQSQLYNCLMTVAAKPSGESNRELVTKYNSGNEKKHSAETTDAVYDADETRKNFRILLAEDNELNQKVAVNQLKKLGYTADIVGNGREAVNAFQTKKYDLILMDCQMPELDGYEATGEIRRLENGSEKTIIVALTAHAMEGELQKCLAAGMNDYLSKPVKTETLRQVIERWAEAKVEVQT